ncbi:MAG: Aerobic carbon monoxide dehydrogenase (quinone), medium chain, partial [uncultured Thermomicrobiales bacterium]
EPHPVFVPQGRHAAGGDRPAPRARGGRQAPGRRPQPAAGDETATGPTRPPDRHRRVGRAAGRAGGRRHPRRRRPDDAPRPSFRPDPATALPAPGRGGAPGRRPPGPQSRHLRRLARPRRPGRRLPGLHPRAGGDHRRPGAERRADDPGRGVLPGVPDHGAGAGRSADRSPDPGPRGAHRQLVPEAGQPGLRVRGRWGRRRRPVGRGRHRRGGPDRRHRGGRECDPGDGGGGRAGRL